MGDAEEDVNEKVKGYDETVVHDACDALNAEGIRPTYQAVRLKLGGRGSFSYIAAGIKSWEPKQTQPAPPLPAEIVDRVTTFAAAVWQGASTAAHAAFSIERQEQQQRIAELERGIADYETDQKYQSAEIERLTKANTAAIERIEEIEDLLQERAGRIAALEQVLERSRGKPIRPPRRKGLRPTLETGPTDGNREEFGQ